MSQYTANTAELRNLVNKLQATAGEMSQAIIAVDRAMNNARAMKAPRIQQNVANWEQVKKALEGNLTNANEAATIINKTAQDIDAVMGG